MQAVEDAGYKYVNGKLIKRLREKAEEEEKTASTGEVISEKDSQNELDAEVEGEEETEAEDYILHSDRDFSYSELVAKDDLQGFVIGKAHQVQLKTNGSIDDSFVFSEAKKGCKTIQTNGGTVYFVDVPDIGRNVEITKNGVTHSFMRPNDKKKGVPTQNALLNARVAIKIPDVLKKSIEVNRSQRGNNIDVPYTHVMIGTVALENVQGALEYYAVRSMIQERKNQNPILVEVNILGKLYATNAKKISTPTVRGVKKGVALADGDAYEYSIADFLQDVKGVFDDTFSADVYNRLGAARKNNDFSKNLMFSLPNRSTTDAAYLKAVEDGDMETAQRMVDEAAKRAGYKKLFYHGSKKGGGFTVFRDWSYFSENKAYAERYADRNNLGSLYTTYVKLEKTFDTRKASVRKVFNEIRKEYGLSEIQESGLPDWTDGYDISDYIEENDLNYDGIVLDEGGDLVDGEPISRGESYVVRKSNQVKSADPVTYDDDGNVIPLSKRFNTADPDIRFSLPKRQSDGTQKYYLREEIANVVDAIVAEQMQFGERHGVVDFQTKRDLVRYVWEKLNSVSDDRERARIASELESKLSDSTCSVICAAACFASFGARFKSRSANEKRTPCEWVVKSEKNLATSWRRTSQI